MSLQDAAIDTPRKFGLPLLAALIIVGLLGNHFKFPIFLNIDFLFGSIFAMLALQMFGLGRGIAAGALIACYTYVLWNHPYAIVIMTAEVAVVGWLMERKKLGMVLAAALYWLFVGMPLVYLFYREVMEAALSSVELTMVKQATNGIANALVARLIFSSVMLRTHTQRIYLRELITNLLIAFLLVQSLTMLALSSRQDFAETDQHIRETLQQTGGELKQKLDSWQFNRSTSLAYLAEMATTKSPQQMQPLLEQTQRSDQNFLHIGLIDQNATSIAFYPPTDQHGSSVIGKSFADRDYLTQLKQMLTPMLSGAMPSKTGESTPIVALLAPVINAGEYRGYIAGVLELNEIKAALDTNLKTEGLLYTLVDSHNLVILSNRTNQTMMAPFARGEGGFEAGAGKTSRWVPKLPPNTPTSERWKKSTYVTEQRVGTQDEWMLIIEQPVAPFQKALFTNYAEKMELLFLILLGALVLAELLGRRALSTLEQLRSMTSTLPDKLAQDDRDIVWPESGVKETHHLIRNYQKMADSLTMLFTEVKQNNEVLEQRVAERTGSLLESETAFRKVLEASNDGVLLQDSTAAFVECNQVALDMLKMTREQFIRMTPDQISVEFQPNGRRSEEYAPEMTALGWKGFHRFDWTCRNLEGEEFIVEVTLVPITLKKQKMLHCTWHDITERKRVEEALLRHHTLLNDTGRMAHVGGWEIDLAAQTLTWTNEVYRIHEVEADFVPSLNTAINFYAPESRPVIEQAVQQAVEQALPFDVQLKIITAKGNRRWVHAVGRAEKKDGKTTRVFGTFQDITERKQTEAALKRSEEEKRSLIAALPDVIMRFDAEGRHLFTSSNVEDVFPLKAEDFLGKTHRDLGLPEEMCEVWEHALRQPFITGTEFETEFTLDCLKGRRTFNWRLTPDFDEKGGVRTVLAIARDITERKQAEIALRESEESLSITLHSIGDGVIATDTAGRVTQMNPAAERLCGCSLVEAVGHPLPEVIRIVNVDTREAVADPVQQVMASGEVVGLANHTLLLSKDGKEYQIADSAAPIRNAGGDIVGVVLVFSDVTEKYHMEETLRLARFSVDAASDSLFWITPDARIFDVNASACRSLGYSREELLQLTVPDVDSHYNAELWPQHFAELRQRGSLTFESEQRTRDGRLLPVEIVANYVRRGNEEFNCAFVRDITQRKQAEEALRQSEAHFRQMFERNDSVLLLIEPATGKIIDANPAASYFYGYPLEKLKTMLISEINTMTPQEIASKRARAFERKQNFFIFQHRLSSGELRTVEVRSSPIDLGGHDLLFSIVQDVTAQEAAKNKLQLAASVFSNSREAIMITEADGTIIDCNDAFTRITGYGHDEVIGKNPRILSSGLQSREHYAAMWRDLKEKGHWYGEIWNRRKNGEVYAEMQTISTVRDEDGTAHHYVSLFSDISSLKAHQKQLEHIAHYDALTSLPNRVLLADRLQQAMSQALRRRKLLAVAYLDLDGFKAINDKHGHEAGDQLLIALAARMKQTLRDGDTLARIGGDEFVAVLVDLANIEDSVPMITRMLAAAAEPVHVDELTLNISASLGVTFFPQEDDIDADQLQRQADQAMYQAKLAGKNRYHVFDAVQDRSVRGQHESLDRIQRALTEREFVLYYQPKVNMRSGAVIGAEALIRWQHPQKGLLAPATFLQVIEDHPLAIDVGEWVIDTALTQIEAWRAAGLELPVSVNVGARQLQQPDFAERLGILLAAHPDIRPGDLQIEVLETSALEDLARVSEVIDACRRIGISFALDDFGTGYSSLTYLKRLAVAELKIDQSFVRDMLDDPDDLAILEGVIGLANAFRRDAIAEGVETIEHGEMLLQLGCDLAQGYGIARPMPATELPGWATNWHAPSTWVNRPAVSRDDLPLLYAIVEHRAWIAAMGHYLAGERAAPPPLDPTQCRFGIWLEAERKAGLGTQPWFTAIDPLHQQVHALANELCGLHAQGRAMEIASRLGELHNLRDTLLEHLQSLLAQR